MLACDVLPRSGTLASLTQSDDLLRELRDVVTAALSLPARLVEVVEASLPPAGANRQMLQTSNLDILIQLSQEEASEPMGTDNAAAVVRPSLPAACPRSGNSPAPPTRPPDTAHAFRYGSQWSRRISQT